ncbi:MAG TPA: flagellin [Terriglobales bacterium]|nr:flagellin [Terriglobales bacterium]
MRISDTTIVRNYMTTLSGTSAKRAKDSLTASTGRAYQTVSEDPVAAVKAMKIRRGLSRIEDYCGNIEEFEAVSNERESAATQLNDIFTEISTLVQQGKSGTYSESDRESIATALRSYQETIFNIGNSSYSGKYIFGGTDEYAIPFTLDAMGNLLYKGVGVDAGTFAPESRSMDISEGTTVNTAYSGVSLLGWGTDGSGLPNNVYSLVGEIATAMENNDLTDMDAYAAKLEELQESVTVQHAEIGAQCKFIEFFSDRLTATKTNLTERQTGLEGVDSAEAIMYYNLASSAYDATLAMGARLIPQTLLDYLP